jgi:hypothetical protein
MPCWLPYWNIADEIIDVTYIFVIRYVTLYVSADFPQIKGWRELPTKEAQPPETFDPAASRPPIRAMHGRRLPTVPQPGRTE